MQGKAEGRRSHRLFLVMRLGVAWTREDGTRAIEDAETEEVNACGALLRIKPNVLLPLEFEIINRKSNQSTRVRLVGVDLLAAGGLPPKDGMRRLAVELAVPGRTFWGVTIPPLPGTVSLHGRLSTKSPSCGVDSKGEMMQPSQERRHLESEREKYPALHLYARVARWSSVMVLVVGVVLGVALMLFAPQPLWARVSNGLLTMAVGAVYFIAVRGAAETLDLLLDVARNTRASRLEKG